MVRYQGVCAIAWAVCCCLSAHLLPVTAATEQPNVKTVTVFSNGKSTGGVSVSVSADDFLSGHSFAEFLSNFTVVEMEYIEGGVVAERAYTGKGTEITEYSDFNDGDNVYLVPEGFLFVWPFVELGHKVELESGLIQLPTSEPVILESISDSPRVFHIANFLSPEEADQLIANVESITDEKLKLQRSSVGKETEEKSYSEKRTSHNAFDTDSETAITVMKRMFELLRVPTFDKNMADGLQILRYQQKQAYVAHEDYFEGDVDRHFNFDPALNGSNRFATVFLYLSDVEEGGQTVFPHANRPDHQLFPKEDVPQSLASLFNESQWEYDLVRKCYTKLAVKPKKAQAVLFYSQTGSARMDPASLHGGCPVLSGTKWAANLWLWNRVRYGMHKVDQNFESTKVTVMFVNKEAEEVALLWKSTVLATLQPGQKSNFNTFGGHEWHAQLGGSETIIWSTVIDASQGPVQEIEIKSTVDQQLSRDEL